MQKVVVANFYPVYPIEHGGQRRIYFLARELATRFSVTLVTLSRGQPLKYLELGPGLTEIQVPAERQYMKLERELLRAIPMAADVAYAEHWKQCRLYQSILREQIRASAVAISEHPYSFYAIRDAVDKGRSVPVVYNSQNVEVIQKAPVLKGRNDLMEVVSTVERVAVTESAAVIACSESDRAAFLERYSLPSAKAVVIRNGVDCAAVPRLTSDRRETIRRRLGLDRRFTAVFGGSLHFPNLSAVDCIIAAAERLPTFVFIILGSVCRYAPLHRTAPKNVLSLGSIPEPEKWLALAASDLALNPMSLGSGSNIKMFEYAAAGLPTLSTAFGARGTGMITGVHYFESEIDAFADRIAEIANLAEEHRAEVGARAQALVSEASDWRVIGKEYRSLIERLTIGTSEVAAQ